MVVHNFSNLKPLTRNKGENPTHPTLHGLYVVHYAGLEVVLDYVPELVLAAMAGTELPEFHRLKIRRILVLIW